MTAETGSYILLLRLPAPVTATVGRLGRLRFDQPYYAYAGSAFGPGGLPARVGRHLRLGKKKHWHIDYLRELTEVVAVWTLVDSTRRECLLADLLASLKDASPVARFGATDCRCGAHLVGLERLPRLDRFRTQLNLSLGDNEFADANLRIRNVEGRAGAS